MRTYPAFRITRAVPTRWYHALAPYLNAATQAQNSKQDGAELGSDWGNGDRDQSVFSVQHHPEAGPGPHDSMHLFERFREMILGASTSR